MTQVFDFKEADVMTCHAWNKDCSQLAMSPRSNELFIYKYDGRGTLTFSEKLIAHTQRINSVDWCPVKNRIITAGADRNVYVWNLISNKWTKTLVIMRSNRAAVSVQWSYNGEKFACGCASRLLAIAYYDEKNNWWTSKLIKKKIRSTVTCVSWSPDLAVIACGTSGFKARIFGTIIKDYDKFVPTSKWSDNLNVGNPIQEYTCEGWVNDIQFDGTGDKLVWVCNNSSISLVTSADPTAVRTLNFNALPLMSIMWKSNECIIGVGFDTCLYSFKVGNEIKMESTFDNESKGKCGKVSAMSHFKSLDTYAISPSAEGPNKNKHNSTIIEIRTYRGNTAKFSTISNEGKMIVWDTKDLTSKFNNLYI